MTYEIWSFLTYIIMMGKILDSMQVVNMPSGQYLIQLYETVTDKSVSPVLC